MWKGDTKDPLEKISSGQERERKGLSSRCI